MSQRLGVIARALDGDMDDAGGEQLGGDRGAGLLHVRGAAAAGADQQQLHDLLALVHIEIEGRAGLSGESGGGGGIAHEGLGGDRRRHRRILGEEEDEALRLGGARCTGKDPH